MTPDRPDETLAPLSPENAEKSLRQFVRDVRPGSCRIISCALNGTSCDCPLCLIDIIADRNHPETVTLRRLSAEKDARLKSAQDTMEAYRLRALVADEDKRLETVDCANVLKLWMDANARLVEQLAEKDSKLAGLAHAIDDMSATLARLEQERDSLVTALNAAMCPRCDQTIMRAHAPDCNLPTALDSAFSSTVLLDKLK